MIQQCLRYAKGYVHINFYGEEKERFLNLCSANDIILWKLMPQGEGQMACMSISDFKKLRPISRKTKIKIRIAKKRGLPFFFQKSRKRKAFFLGILCFCALIYTLSLRIWNIHVDGNITYSTQTVLKYLEQENIRHGILKKSVNCAEVASMLRREFPNITWVSARIEGTRLFLEMKENYNQEQEQQTVDQESTPLDIVAKKSGTVMSIVTRSGVPLVKVGDQFKKGDILVSGTLEIKNDAQETIGYEYTSADADLYARTSYSYYDEFPMEYEERIYTEDQKNSWFFTVMNYRVDIGPSPPEDQRYDQVATTHPLYLTENFVLPFTYGTIQTLPYQIEVRQYTKEEAAAKANANLYMFLKNLTQKGVEIYRKNVKIDTSESTCITKGKIQVTEKITTTAPVKIQEVIPERTSEE